MTASRLVLGFWVMLPLLLVAPLAFGLGSAEIIGPEAAGGQGGRLARLGLNSALMAAGAAGLALVPALLTGVTAARLERPAARSALLAVALVPLFVSPPVLAVAAIRMFGPAGFFSELLTGGVATFPVTEQIRGPSPQVRGAPIYTLAGGAFTLAWGLAPLAVLAVAAVLSRTDRAAEEAALLEASPLRVLARLTIPGAAGAFAAGAGLVFLFAVTEFGVPESLRSLPVLVSEVYVQAGVFFDMRAALAAGLLLAVLALAGLGVAGLAARRLLSDDEALSETASSSDVLPARGGTAVFRGGGWLAGVLPAGALVFILWHTADGPQGRLAVWRATWSTAWEELVFTILLAGAAALLTAAAGMLLGAALSRQKSPWLWRGLLCVPLVLPGPVLGVAVQVLLRRPPGSLPLGLDDALANLSNTHVPLMLVWVLKFAPVAVLLVERALRRLPEEVLEAARVDGAGRFALLRGILLPAAFPAVVAGGLMAFALCAGEVGASVLLLPPGRTTLGVRLLTLMHYAPTGQVSALCLLLVVPALTAWGMVLVALRAARGMNPARLERRAA